jgi:hydroxymethylbilane synthase
MPGPLLERPERPLRIGTRGSPLALAQARLVAAAILAATGWDEEALDIVPITTSGDRIQDRPLAEMGGKALWTRELDRCLLDGRTDLSVHSMKDVETFRPDSLVIAAVMPRADPRDRLIGAPSLNALREGARLGTSSPRRRAQLLARRPDLEIVTLRGNVQTRLAKVERGEVDATLLAAAGLDRIGLGAVGIALDDLLPAPAQGTVGVEIRANDTFLAKLAAAIDAEAARRCVEAERALLAGLGGDCHSAVAALARPDGDGVLVQAEILSADGREMQRGESRDPAALATALLDAASPALRAMFTR